MKNTRCRICKNEHFFNILDMNKMPLANAFLEKKELNDKENYYPLKLVRCESCGLVQIDEIIPPEILFKNYIYVSGTSQALSRHFRDLAAGVVRDFKLNTKSLIIDIGSNDGTLLKVFKKYGCQVIGVEPAENIAKIAKKNGITTVTNFFSGKVAKKIIREHGNAKVITATNVFAHTHDLESMLEGISILLENEGVFIIEVPYLFDLLENLEFDTIYHEHLSYFAVKPLDLFFNKNGFKIINIERVKIHGGSIRIFVSKHSSGFSIDQSVVQLQLQEKSKGFNDNFIYKHFSEKVKSLKINLVKLLASLKKENKKVIGYGAAAKGNTLLNYYQIGPDLIEFIADLNPMKQNKFTPGTHIPVYNTQKIYQEKYDYMLILAWNFTNEIINQQKKFKELGGKFIVPIPDVRVF